WLNGKSTLFKYQDFWHYKVPLLTTVPHNCLPFLENELEQIVASQENSSFAHVATHLPYNSLPESIRASNCKIVYIYRNFLVRGTLMVAVTVGDAGADVRQLVVLTFWAALITKDGDKKRIDFTET
ncbi:hypothetical protein M8C21_024926, partial [Ambrosia artemisiifolia]